MKDNREGKNTYAFRLSQEKIKAFRGSSAEERLNWLDEANNFIAEFVPEEKLRRWRKFTDEGK
jgi:hypothetical protein